MIAFVANIVDKSLQYHLIFYFESKMLPHSSKVIGQVEFSEDASPQHLEHLWRSCIPSESAISKWCLDMFLIFTPLAFSSHYTLHTCSKAIKTPNMSRQFWIHLSRSRKADSTPLRVSCIWGYTVNLNPRFCSCPTGTQGLLFGLGTFGLHRL